MKKQSAYNTLWCLIGCSIGDFGTILFFQITLIKCARILIMILAIINGIITSIVLETIILVKQMDIRNAFKTALGMSLVSMITMETVMNVIDWSITGGAKLNFWIVPLMLIGGFFSAWPYNYWRLKKFNESCH